MKKPKAEGEQRLFRKALGRQKLFLIISIITVILAFNYIHNWYYPQKGDCGMPDSCVVNGFLVNKPCFDVYQCYNDCGMDTNGFNDTRCQWQRSDYQMWRCSHG